MNKPRSPRANQIPKNSPEENTESLPSTTPVDSLQEKLQSQVGELLPAGSRDEILRRITTVIYGEKFSGPIAHPKHLREYESVQPGSADRIITMAENQQNHQISMDRLVVEKEYGDRRLGMLIGAALFALLICCAFASALLGNNIVAGLFLTTAAIGGVSLFVNGRKDRDK
ncbi:MAG: DUF2335 domain-containing protein [Rhodobacteraceae bacterium]|nr:DUF2335 domain-containing protein [Paracoccaceae bacterium]